jgi:hypothetical protein
MYDYHTDYEYVEFLWKIGTAYVHKHNLWSSGLYTMWKLKAPMAIYMDQ